jgi:D-3-phosphoglycerate dehydrogenase
MRVVVSASSFAAHPYLRDALLAQFPQAIFLSNEITSNTECFAKAVCDAEFLLCGRERIDAALLDACPKLQIIAKYGVGLDNLDLRAMQSRGIKLGWQAGVNAMSVAEHALAMMLMLSRRMLYSHEEIRAQQWRKQFGRDLSSCTIGIIGCGHVGKSLIRLLKPFHCKMLIHDVRYDESFNQQYGLETVDLDTLLVQSDIVSLHTPLNQSTYQLINQNRLQQMPAGAFLINTARGGIVDERALLNALQNNHLAGAALDVFAEEPLKDWRLAQHPHCLLTAHIAGSTQQAQHAMGMAAIAGLRSAQLISDEFIAEYSLASVSYDH